MERNRYMILDDNGVLWADDSYDAFETGSEIMGAVENGRKKKLVEKSIGNSWVGDLVLVQEICRAR